jgi:hypothetical protein
MIDRMKERKKNKILTKNTNMTQNNCTAVKHWYPLSFYCFAPLGLSLVLFPEISAIQPFRKGSGEDIMIDWFYLNQTLFLFAAIWLSLYEDPLH